MSALSATLLIFSFQFSLLFFHMGRKALAALRRIGFNTQYWTLDVAENLSWYLSCMVKMGTWHPVEGPFGSKFPAICNCRGVMAAWSHKTLTFCEQFLHFFGKRTLMVKFSKFYSERSHGDTNRRFYVEIHKICPMGNRRNHALFTWQKNVRLPLKLSLLHGSRPKSARSSLKQCAHNAPGFI